MKYEFRTANGQLCCSGDEFACLCAACKEKARSSSPRAAASGVVPRASASSGSPSTVPPPPDLTAAIRQKRIGVCRVEENLHAPKGTGTFNPAPSTVPSPPDLADAIRRKRTPLAPGNISSPRPPQRMTAAQRAAEIRKFFAVRQPMADGGRP